MIIVRVPLRISLSGGGTDTIQFLESEKESVHNRISIKID